MAGMFETGAYHLPKVNLGMSPQGPAQPQLTPEVIAMIEALMGAGGQGALTTNMLGGEIAPPQTIPAINPMASPTGDAMTAAAPKTPAAAPATPGQDWFTGGGIDALMNTITTPGAGFQSPLPRGPQNTGLENTRNGIANGIINLPQNMWHLYSEGVGKPFQQAVSPVVGNILDWASKPEAQVQADANAAVAPNPMQGFQPGIPGNTVSPAGGPAGSGGKQNLVSAINQAESAGNNKAKNPKSSAYGPGQFIKGTWMDFIKEVHPELVTSGKMKEKELLELRSDPAMSDEATSWYAGKAVDVLDSLNQPATDGNIYLHHLLGPEGVKNLLTADPTAKASSVLGADQVKANASILGGTRTVQDVKDWADAKMGGYSYVPAGAPPIPRPDTPMPDFSEMNQWLDKSAPTPVDPQQLKNMQLQTLLANIGNGLNSVNAEKEGGGALFGALAEGVTSGSARWHSLETEMSEAFKKQMQDYSLGRAKVAGEQSAAKTSATQANLEGDWLDANDQRDFQNAEVSRVALNDETKRLDAEADAEKAKLAATPKILNTSDKGMVIQMPDGSVVRETFEAGDQFAEAEKLGKIFGQDSNLFRQQKYSTMVQQGKGMLIPMQAEIIRDLVSDGIGASIWGDAYGEALAAAEEQLPEGIAPGTDGYQDAINKSLMGLLLGASQATGNYDWVMQAAALGHPGAMMLVQGGKLPEEEK